MTMLPNSPEFVVKELLDVFDKKADDFWIVNCSNIKPHAYYLDLIAGIWRDDNEKAGELISAVESGSEAVDAKIRELVVDFRDNYCAKYFGKEYAIKVAKMYELWPDYCPSYGVNYDDHAGEQFTNHGARVLATAFVTNFYKKNPAQTPAADEWLWFSGKKTLKEQLDDYSKIIEPAAAAYKEYLDKCRDTAGQLPKKISRIMEDILIWQVEYHYYSYLGALHTCRALQACLVEINAPEETAENEVIDCISQEQDKEGSPDFLAGFYEAGLAAKAFKSGYEQMRGHERGVFEGFFDNDCEADIRQSYYVSKALMSFMRFHGDGPHFYKWQRMYQQGAGGNKVHLILRIRKHLTDEELWELMKDAN